MASGIRETTKPQLEIYLEKPWGGVASDADAVDIADNQFVSGQGIIDIDGQLCQVNATADPGAFKFFPNSIGAVPLIIFNIGGGLFAVDQFGAVYVFTIIGGPPRFVFGANASDGPWVGANLFTATMSVQTLNGLAYIGVPFRTSIYTFSGASGTGLVLASNFTGGSIIGTLDDYLLQMNTNSLVDGEKPTRVNWSSPGAFSVWDPSIDRSAGFNTLVNIEDAITGFISLASVGLIIGQKGMVEASPTGIGIQPFSFTSLWTSEVGQGILYPNTVAQYGQNTYASSDDGVYKISTAGFNEISEHIRTLLLGPVQESSLGFFGATRNIPPLFAGNVLLYAYNSSYPTPYYVLATTTPQMASGQRSMLIVWFLNLKTGIWFYQIFDFINLVNQQNGTAFTDLEPAQLKIASVTTLGFNAGANGFNTLPNLLIYGSGVNPSDATGHAFIAPIYIFNKKNLTTALNTPGNLAIASKAWEMKLGRKPSIRRVIIKAYGSGSLNIFVNDISFGIIQLDGTTTSKVYKTPMGICTEEAPQLIITSNNFKGVIIKAMLAGTYADGDID
jgi:hypothetical protein